ncbi:putative Vitamin B12 transporter BtuB [Nitrospira sp. KM1]|uniref:TonB-dependent receptor plug domain-containing protein n=1 Tax=Nitrospira sp. KM1 TaxID=1936990 RepID=UPI0013A73571|nr:TonB-dependent receptor [Nitrospira sp. KM1]BCA53649.1 putative Vitamin B12 transporter BtuB [Nitrospira sp. KM1]
MCQVSVCLVIRVLILVIGLAVPVQTVRAQEVAMAESSEVIETQEVVVSATKTETPIREVTSAVEVISGEQMQQRKVRTVAEALRWAQGMAVFQSGGPGTNVDVRMRGGTPEQTLVLIDGAIVNSATLGTYDFANLTSDNIERIEILRGSQGMMWGSDAMGGVINITTKRGRETPNVSGFAEYGSFNTIREGATVSGKKGPVDVAASLTRWDTASFSAINYRRGASERDGFHNWQGSVRLGVDLPKDGRLDFNFRWMDGITNLDGFAFTDPADVLGAKTQSKQHVFSGSYMQPITDWWSQKLTLARATDNLVTSSGTLQRNLVTGFEDTPFAFNSEISTTSNRIEWQHDFQVAKPVMLTAGYQFREQLGEFVDTLNGTSLIPNKGVSSNAGFAEAKLNLWDRLFGTAGIRQDEYNVFGSATTYRVTAGYLVKETGTKLRGSYGTGFRAPTINQLFFPDFGNPNLKPEKSKGLDIALDQSLFNDRVLLSAGYFWTRYQNLILSVFDPAGCPPGGFGFCAQNIGAARADGLEASAKIQVVRDRPWIKSLDVQFQYTYTNTENLTDNANTRLPKWPLHQWSTIVSYQPVESFRANLEGRYIGQRFNDTFNDQPISSFYVWNASATYDVSKSVQIYGRADNIFGRRYEEVLYFGTPIKSIFGGVRINFDVPL